MHRYSRDSRPVVVMSPMQLELAEVLRRQSVPLRRARKTSWRVKDAARTPPRFAVAGTLERIIDERIGQGVPDGEIMQLVRVFDRHVRTKLRIRARAEARDELVASLGEAFEAEQRAQADADIAQMRALQHPTPGVLRQLWEKFWHQSDATDTALRAVEREIETHAAHGGSAA